MVAYILVLGKTTSNMERFRIISNFFTVFLFLLLKTQKKIFSFRGLLIGVMGTSTLANLKLENNMDMVYMFGQLAENTKERFGKFVFFHFFFLKSNFLMSIFNVCSGKTIKCKVKVHIGGMMELFTLDNGKMTTNMV